jgi:alpha-glucosidase
VFGGPAWAWDARRCQYYLHNFLTEQPDLNVHNREVQDALLGCARFWLERGVDGFRLDAIDYAMHDPALTDNPPRPDDGRPRTRPVDYQQPRYNRGHADLVGFIERVRALTDSYGGRFTVAEIGGVGAEPIMQLLTEGERRLHTAYGFNFLYADALTPALVRESLEAWPQQSASAWPSWAFSNHDAPRAVSRWSAPADRAAGARLALLLLVSLRGNVFLYQGEELGLPQAQVGYADLKDPEAIANWPRTLGRDGARTPMPWLQHAPHAGFSSVIPWLPVPAAHAVLAVDAQQRDSESTLSLARRFIALRRSHAALRLGSMRILEASSATLSFERAVESERLVCAFNLGTTPQRLAAAPPGEWRVLLAVGGATPWALPPLSGLIAVRG